MVRVAGAIAVLLAMVLIVATLVPPYVRNWRFGQALKETAASQATATLRDEQIREMVAQRAAALGLLVSSGQVEVFHEGAGLRLDVKYSTRVETPVYTVDLHFHPSAAR